MRRDTSIDPEEGRLCRRTRLLALGDPGRSAIHSEPCLGAGWQHAPVCWWPAGWKKQGKHPPPPFMASFFHLQNADSHCLQHPVGASLPHPRPPRKRLRNSPSSYTVSNITFPSAERKGRMFWGAEELFGVEL